MAMVCVSGGRECDGCGRCFLDAQTYTYPACGEELNETDEVYIMGNEIIGCEYCTEKKQAFDAFEE